MIKPCVSRPSVSIRAFWAAAAVSAIALCLVGASGSEEDKPSGVLVDTGRAEFLRYCASCHGVDAHGKGPVAETLRTPPADLTRIAKRHGGRLPAGEIAAYIDGRTMISAHGTREMPVWGRILGEKVAEGTTEDEVARGRIDALVAYLMSIQE
ncbi:MAG TPA: cytochrome c [Myxococcota bacterium]|nr:cytochrome c [Myxococcota bacterium]